ncbi:MAG: TIGR03936 family radical SAM-associated protein [Oscillospiraceae bacterium]|nr:TIGR03936 family radical SAM-associated protein [Oscillospiraceae bacterium]
MDKLRLKFAKTGRAAYISHLDLIRTMQRIFSRAGVPLKYSEGFNPHAKISIILPLPVGTESECEYMDFSLAEERALETLPDCLNPYMPEGIRAIEAYPAPRKGSELRWLRYEGVMRHGRDGAYYNEFFAQPELWVTRRSKRGERLDNVAPGIGRAVFTDTPEGVAAELLLHAQEPTVSPELLLSALGEDGPDYYAFTRKEAFLEDMTPFR